MTYDRVQDPRHSKNLLFHQTEPATWSLVNYSKGTKCRQDTVITQYPIAHDCYDVMRAPMSFVHDFVGDQFVLNLLK